VPVDYEFHFRWVGVAELIDEADLRMNFSTLKLAGQRVKTLGDQNAVARWSGFLAIWHRVAQIPY
jgi:hypothetical protein